MPLLAYRKSGEPLVAPLMADSEWEKLRASRDRDAWMPYDRGQAIPKVSRLGTRFFAHTPGQSPQGGGETDIHLYLKAQCLIGARDAGWEALPEQSGRTPDGQDWRADVLCRRPGKAWSVAFEAQVQLQGEETYYQRQARYAAAGIRALWLVTHRHGVLDRPDQSLPAFKAAVWRGRQGRPAATVHIDGLSLGVAEFVSGALSRQLHWYENGRHGTVILVMREDQCWHRTCRKTVLLAYKAETPEGDPFDIEAAQEMKGYGEAYSKAKAALPNLADSPRPWKSWSLTTRCPHCNRDIRYQSHDWGNSDGNAYIKKGDDFIPIDTRIYVPIGIEIPEEARSLGLAPHAQWHWGSEDRWLHWAPLGDIGAISHQRRNDKAEGATNSGRPKGQRRAKF